MATAISSRHPRRRTTRDGGLHAVIEPSSPGSFSQIKQRLRIGQLRPGSTRAELKREIKKLYDGDTNAFSSIFETVLKRKLSGKSDKLDEDLVKELGSILGSQESLDSEEDDDISVESESDKRSDDTSDEEDKLC